MGMHANNTKAVNKVYNQMLEVSSRGRFIEDEIYRMVINAMASVNDFLFPSCSLLRFFPSSASVWRTWKPPPTTRRT